METIDDEATERALGFIDRAHRDGKPFFVWYNTSAMHFRTHRAEKHGGKSGQGFYNDVMVAHDENIGRMLKKLDAARHRREHHRHALDRQRAALQQLARCRDHPVLVEEEHQLGGGLAHPGLPALARKDSRRERAQRDRGRPGHAADAACRGRRAGDQGEAPRGLPGRVEDLPGPHRRLQHAPVPDGRGRREPAPDLLLHQRRRRHPGDPAQRLEGRPDGAAGQAAGDLDGTVRAASGSRSSSTCGATRSSGPTRTRTPTTTG